MGAVCYRQPSPRRSRSSSPKLPRCAWKCHEQHGWSGRNTELDFGSTERIKQVLEEVEAAARRKRKRMRTRRTTSKVAVTANLLALQQTTKTCNYHCLVACI